MRRLGIIAALAFAIPAFAYADDAQLQILLAQVAALQSQIASLQEKSSVAPGIRLCVPPQRNLARGDSGDDVANLQIFLAREPSIYPEGTVVGTFGPATERAVQRFQSLNNLVTSGSPATNGYGAVGPRTLALLQAQWNCGGSIGLGWFNASMDAGIATFSAQASSTVPLDRSIYIDAGDGSKFAVTVSNSVCRTTAGPCSSLLSATHPYAAGKFTATLRRALMQGGSQTLAAIDVVSTGASAQAIQAADGNGAAAQGSAGHPGTSITYGASRVAPSIRILSPGAGTNAVLGSTMTISWSASYAPQNASVSLLLKNGSGAVMGTIASGLHTVGSFWWSVPAPSSGTCAGNAFSCLLQIANPNCTGICGLSAGSYSIIAQLSDGGSIAAQAESPKFAAVSASIAAPSLISTSTASTGASNATTSTGSAGAFGSFPATTSIAGSASCTYSGIPYGSGITLQVGCGDVAGLTCGSFGTLSLTCRNGTWVDGNGNAASVPNVTNFNSDGQSCTTPWGGQTVQSGQQITYEPFFTGGNYTGASVVPLMQCTKGAWQKCNWDGTGCKAYSVTS